MTTLGRKLAPVLCRMCKHVQPLKIVHFTQNSKLIPKSLASLRKFSSTEPKGKVQKETVTINFHLPENRTETVQAKVGENLLDIILQNDVDIDGFGACEGTLACSTCHLIFKPEDFDKIEDKPTDEELDMLDLAYGLCDTVVRTKNPIAHPKGIPGAVSEENAMKAGPGKSRLGCQVIVTKEMDGLDINVPAGVADAREV